MGLSRIAFNMLSYGRILSIWYPPFLAYYGVATNNASVLQASVEQCRLYRQILLANTTSGPFNPPVTYPDVASGLWEHIIGPVNGDPGLWSTGNAWAAAGMIRVLATVIKAPSEFYQHTPTSASHLSVRWKNQAVHNLTTFICEILDAAMLIAGCYSITSTTYGGSGKHLEPPCWRAWRTV